MIRLPVAAQRTERQGSITLPSLLATIGQWPATVAVESGGLSYPIFPHIK